MKKTADQILTEMAATFKERNAVYKNNYKMVGKIMAALFPNGISKELLHSDHFHLVELIVVKLTRFAISDLSHADSVHDVACYAALIESILTEQKSLPQQRRTKKRKATKSE